VLDRIREQLADDEFGVGERFGAGARELAEAPCDLVPRTLRRRPVARVEAPAERCCFGDEAAGLDREHENGDIVGRRRVAEDFVAKPLRRGFARARHERIDGTQQAAFAVDGRARELGEAVRVEDDARSRRDAPPVRRRADRVARAERHAPKAPHSDGCLVAAKIGTG